MAENRHWRTLADMDLEFGRSRRRSLARRARNPSPRPNVPRAARTVLVGALLFTGLGLLGQSGGLNLAASAERPKQGALPANACPVPRQFRSAFDAAAAQTKLPLALLVALAGQESRMDPNARSHAGALGLLQLMPETARELRLDPNVPRTNVLAGARYLRRMIDRFGGDIDLALAAYNAGPTAVATAGGAPTTGVLTYVANVKSRWAALSGCR